MNNLIHYIGNFMHDIEQMFYGKGTPRISLQIPDHLAPLFHFKLTPLFPSKLSPLNLILVLVFSERLNTFLVGFQTIQTPWFGVNPLPFRRILPPWFNEDHLRERLPLYSFPLNPKVMAAKPIAMEQLKQVLTLHKAGQSIKGFFRLTGLSLNTVRAYVTRVSEDVCHTIQQTDAGLADIFNNDDVATLNSDRYQHLLKPFEGVERELSRLGGTRQLLWCEYLDQHPDGYGYSQYCYYLKRWLN